MEKIITYGGRQFLVQAAGPITPEIEQAVMQKMGCRTCGGGVAKVHTLGTANCPATPIPVGSTRSLAATVSQGTSPFTYNWRITRPDSVQDTLPNSPGPNNYTFSQAGVYTARLDVVDSCPSGGLTDFATCNVSVQAPTLNSISISGCAASIGVAGTCNLTASCTDQFGSVMACPALTWTSSNPSVASVSNGVVTGVGAGSATLTASNGSVTSNQITVTVTAGCVSPACGFTLS